MSIDWSKYPPLPQAPELPQWRDTPEHEAYWKKVCDIRTPLENDKVIWGFFVLWGLFSILFIWLFRFAGEWGWGSSIFAGIIVGCIFTHLPWEICHKIFYCIAKYKISKRHGFSLRKLNRPDISKEIGDVLSVRPDFDEVEFCKYWQNEDQARAAICVLVSTKGEWYLHKKMLYPNDPLLLFFYGKKFFLGKERMINDAGEFFEDIEDEFYFYECNEINEGISFAEFVERCALAMEAAE